MKKLQEQNKELYDLARDTWENLTNTDKMLTHQLFAKRYYHWDDLSDEKQRTMVELVRNVVAVLVSTQSLPDSNFVKMVRNLLRYLDEQRFAELTNESMQAKAHAAFSVLSDIGRVYYHPVFEKMAVAIQQENGSTLHIVNIGEDHES